MRTPTGTTRVFPSQQAHLQGKHATPIFAPALPLLATLFTRVISPPGAAAFSAEELAALFVASTSKDPAWKGGAKGEVAAEATGQPESSGGAHVDHLSA